MAALKTPQPTTFLGQELRRRMEAAGIKQKALALQAGLNETYVRDILSGKSKKPQAEGLAKIAKVLDCPVSVLIGATEVDAGEFVEDASELLFLRAWRELPQEERGGVLAYIEARLTQIAVKNAAPLDGEAV